MAEGSGVSPAHSSNVLRNILVGVTTTVLGSSAIYFLGFNHKSEGSSGKDYLVVKDATAKAWKSYVTTENIYTKNSLSLMKELQETKKLDDFEENVLAESDKFKNGLEQLMKNEAIDGDFISMIKRRLQNENTVIPKQKVYLEKIKAIVNSDAGQNEKSEKLAAADRDWATYSKGISERSVTDIEDLAKALSERYAQPFAMSDLIIYNMIKNQNAHTDSTTIRNDDRPEPGQVNGPMAPDANNINGANNNPVDNNYTNPNKEKEYTNNSYNNPANTNSVRTVNKNMFAGNWSTNGAEIYLDQGGNMQWNVLNNSDNAYGTWNFNNNQLYMNATNSRTGQQSTWVFNLTNVTNHSFTMTLSVSPYNTYSLVRMKDY